MTGSRSLSSVSSIAAKSFSSGEPIDSLAVLMNNVCVYVGTPRYDPLPFLLISSDAIFSLSCHIKNIIKKKDG